jgi:hypothetical protein
MREFIRRLGKKVQELLDRIFGKEKPTDMYKVVEFSGGNQVVGVVKAKDDEELKAALENLRETMMNADWGTISHNIETQLTLENPTWSKNELENFVNITYPFLPKRIPCRAIILSLAANQQSDYQAVDMSQYEEKGLAHLIIGRTCGLEELMLEYMCDAVAQEGRLDEEDVEWMKEEIVRCKDSGLFSAFIPNATLLHYEAFGVWDFEEAESEEEE